MLNNQPEIKIPKGVGLPSLGITAESIHPIWPCQIKKNVDFLIFGWDGIGFPQNQYLG